MMPRASRNSERRASYRAPRCSGGRGQIRRARAQCADDVTAQPATSLSGSGAASRRSFASERQVLLLQLQQSASKTMGRFDVDGAARRIAPRRTLRSRRRRCCRLARPDSSRCGRQGGRPVDLTGPLPAAPRGDRPRRAAVSALPATGRVPREGRQLGEPERRARAPDEELHNAKDRASSLVTPLATLVGSADAHQAEQ